MDWEYGIVGQGLAGTLLHHYLSQKGKKAVVWDPGGPSCSMISSGILNPLTGRRYVKSWMFDQLIEEAVKTYPQLEGQLEEKFFYERQILRALPNRQAQLDWEYRHSLEEYKKYVGGDRMEEDLPADFRKDYQYVEIRGGHQLRVSRLIDAYREKLLAEGMLREECFHYEILQQQEAHWRYRDDRVQKLVFCEGATAMGNPYFQALPHNPSKSEVLVLDAPHAIDFILKNRIFTVPWEKGQWWIGPANSWKYPHAHPTDKGRKRVVDAWERIYKGEERPVLEHVSALKPSVKDRRPFLGAHPRRDGLYIFNGLGTKGASLGPYFAKQMAEYLVKGKDLQPEVNISRFDGWV